jgi:hypothetical protein
MWSFIVTMTRAISLGVVTERKRKRCGRKSTKMFSKHFFSLSMWKFLPSRRASHTFPFEFRLAFVTCLTDTSDLQGSDNVPSPLQHLFLEISLLQHNHHAEETQSHLERKCLDLQLAQPVDSHQLAVMWVTHSNVQLQLLSECNHVESWVPKKADFETEEAH